MNVRWALRCGVIAAGLLVSGLMIVGSAPGVGTQSDRMASYLAERRGQLLAAAVLLPIAATMLCWFVTAVVGILQRAGRSTIGASAVMSAVIAATCLLLAGAAWATAIVLADQPARADDAAPLLDAARVVLVFSLIPAAGTVHLLGVLLRRSQLRARGLTAVAPVLAGVSVAVVPLAFVASGPLAPGMLFPFVAGLLVGVWSGLLAMALLSDSSGGLAAPEIGRGRLRESSASSGHGIGPSRVTQGPSALTTRGPSGASWRQEAIPVDEDLNQTNQEEDLLDTWRIDEKALARERQEVEDLDFTPEELEEEMEDGTVAPEVAALHVEAPRTTRRR